MNIRRAEHSRAVHVSFILEARGRSHTETYDVQEIPNMDKRTELSFLLMKREDNKHTIAKIYGLCMFFKLSPGNK